jgi:hypothetical protein
MRTKRGVEIQYIAKCIYKENKEPKISKVGYKSTSFNSICVERGRTAMVHL